MSKIFKTRRMWTKDDVRLIYKLWTSKTTAEICDEMKITNMQLNYIIIQMRKAGIDVPKKHKKGHLNNLLYEMAHELK